MMLSLYVTLGVFLLIAARNPSGHRSVIAFTAWSSFAHGAVMTVMAVHVTSAREGLLMVSALRGVIGVMLIVLAPAKPKSSGYRWPFCRLYASEDSGQIRTRPI
jgi:hypothetical protein